MKAGFNKILEMRGEALNAADIADWHHCYNRLVDPEPEESVWQFTLKKDKDANPVSDQVPDVSNELDESKSVQYAHWACIGDYVMVKAADEKNERFYIALVVTLSAATKVRVEWLKSEGEFTKYKLSGHLQWIEYAMLAERVAFNKDHHLKKASRLRVQAILDEWAEEEHLVQDAELTNSDEEGRTRVGRQEKKQKLDDVNSGIMPTTGPRVDLHEIVPAGYSCVREVPNVLDKKLVKCVIARCYSDLRAVELCGDGKVDPEMSGNVPGWALGTLKSYFPRLRDKIFNFDMHFELDRRGAKRNVELNLDKYLSVENLLSDNLTDVAEGSWLILRKD